MQQDRDLNILEIEARDKKSLSKWKDIINNIVKN